MSHGQKYVGIIALPFEATTTFLKGTRNAPRVILDDLERFDGFDVRLGRDPFEGVERRVVFAHGEDLADAHEQQRLAGLAAKSVIDSGGFPLSLGGEHGVTIGPLKAVRSKGEVGIVQLDAHADLRDTYFGDPMNHACAMRRAIELGCPLSQVGIRAICGEDHDVIKSRSIPMVDGYQAATSTSWYSMLDALPRKIYLTVDMDVFNPEEVPAVGTPEPGGPGFEAVVSFLRVLFATKDVVGADIVELMPCQGDGASVRAASRLLGLIIGMRFGN